MNIILYESWGNILNLHDFYCGTKFCGDSFRQAMAGANMSSNMSPCVRHWDE
jgi:hypothetical protein